MDSPRNNHWKKLLLQSYSSTLESQGRKFLWKEKFNELFQRKTNPAPPPLPAIECCFLSNRNRPCLLIMTFFSMVQSLCSSLSFIIYILHFCDWIYIYHECTDPFTWRRWYWIFLLKTIVIITPGNSPEIKKLKRRNRDMSYFDLRQSPRCKK